jgi:hypothetical protein
VIADRTSSGREVQASRSRAIAVAISRFWTMVASTAFLYTLTGPKPAKRGSAIAQGPVLSVEKLTV